MRGFHAIQKGHWRIEPREKITIKDTIDVPLSLPNIVIGWSTLVMMIENAGVLHPLLSFHYGIECSVLILLHMQQLHTL